MTTLRVALISGPQYDRIGDVIGAFARDTGIDVEIAFRGDHPALNRHLADALPAGAAYDLISTHSKYAPSQARWLRPLGDLVDSAVFRPAIVDLCTFRGELVCAPRNVDVRLLWFRRDLVPRPPDTWDALAVAASSLTTPDRAGFAFPGKESGLFGSFFELVVSAGGSLFDADVRPTIATDEARWALSWLVDARRFAPRRLEEWHYDEVSDAFRGGAAAMIGDWPAFYGLLRDGAAGEPDVARYPSGPARRAVYAGAHAWAIPTSCRDLDATRRLLERLTSVEAASHEAAQGVVPARTDVELPVRDDLDRRRADLLSATIAQDMLTFPPLEAYPSVEDAGWTSLRAALLGEVTVDDALERMQIQAQAVLA